MTFFSSLPIQIKNKINKKDKWVGGAVINFDGLSMSSSDNLLDFISIVTT